MVTERERSRDDGGDGERLARPVVAAALALHAGLLWYFVPFRVVLSGAPFHTFDYALHAYQVDRALRAFHAAGRLWSYDPFVLAGQPAGVVEDLTSKSVELFVIAATRLSIPQWVAFDVYVLAVHLALPFVAWKAARLFDLSRLSAALTVLAWVVLWHFDSLLHWFWYVGMISWALAGYLVVLVVALMYRATERHQRSAYLGLAVTSALVTLVHPFAVLPLVAPLAVLYLRSFRGLSRWEHGALAGSVVVSAATTLVWIGPTLRFRHLIGPVDAFLWPTASYALSDWLDLLRDVLMTGEPVRTAFRTIALGLAAFALLDLRKRGDRRALPLATLCVAGVLLAYLSGYSEALRQTQPYRNIGPAVLAAALAAAAVVPDFARASATKERWDRNARTTVVLAFVLAVPPLLRTVVAFVPSVLPRGPKLHAELTEPPLPAGRELDPVNLGYDGPRSVYAEIGEYLGRTVGTSGRVAVLDWVLGEYLATFTSVPILGGIPQRNVPQAAAHPLRLDQRAQGEGDDPLARYMEEYAVTAVVTNGPLGPFDSRRDLLEPVEGFGPYRVYRTHRAPSYVVSGEARVVSQELDIIRIAEAKGPELVLKFHYLETLRCRPNCTVERALALHDAAGFVRIRKPPTEFEIVNVPDDGG